MGGNALTSCYNNSDIAMKLLAAKAKVDVVDKVVNDDAA
jgi:hypothetical protein